MTHDDFPRHDDDNARDAQPSPDPTPGSLENLLDRHLDDLDAEHALLLRMWHTDRSADSDRAAPAREDHQVHPETRAGHITVMHTARALTVGDLRAALIGEPDDRPIAIDVPLHPGGLELYRHVLTSTSAVMLLLADDDEVLDPSLVLRGDFPTGGYEIPTDTAGDTRTGS